MPCIHFESTFGSALIVSPAKNRQHQSDRRTQCSESRTLRMGGQDGRDERRLFPRQDRAVPDRPVRVRRQDCQAYIWFKWADYGTDNMRGIVNNDGSHRPSYSTYQAFISSAPTSQ